MKLNNKNRSKIFYVKQKGTYAETRLQLSRINDCLTIVLIRIRSCKQKITLFLNK